MKKIITAMLVILLMLYLFSNIAYASSTPVVSTNQSNTSYDVSTKIEFLEDKTNTKVLKDILTPESQRAFKRNTTPFFPLSYSKSNYWLKLTVSRYSGDNHDYLIYFDDWGLSKALCYNLNKDGTYEESKSGIDYSYTTREIKGRNIAFKLKNTSRVQTYYFCINAQLTSVNLSIFLKDEGRYYSDTIKDNMFLGFLLGFIMLLVILSHGIFWATKDKAYLFFSINALFMLIWITDAVGLINELLGTTTQMLVHMHIAWLLAIIGLSGICFAMYYLDTKKQHRLIHKIYLSMLLSIIILTLIMQISSFSTVILSLSLAGWIVNILNLIFALYISIKKRYGYVYIYLSSQIILFFGVTVLVLCTFGVVPNNFLTHYSYYICIALQFTTIGYGLVSKIDKSKQELEVMVDDRTSELYESITDLQRTQKELVTSRNDLKTLLDRVYNLLDNSGEGFLSFGSNCIVDPEYSKECEIIFLQKLEGENILKLISLNNEDDYNTYAFNMKIIFETEDDFQKDILTSLLPRVLNINSKIIKIKYKFLEQSKIMMILTDITHEKELEDLIAEEQSRLKLIVSSMMSRGDFFEIIDSSKKFIQTIVPDIIKKEVPSEEKYGEAYRFIHTLKGTSSQLHFINLPKKLHELETNLTALKNNILEAPDSLLNIIATSGYDEALYMDIKVVTDAIGEDFIYEKGNLYLDRKQKRQLERLKEIFSKYSDSKDASLCEAYEIVKTLQYVSIKKLLELYPKYTLQLAEGSGKCIYEYEIEGKDFKIDPERYTPFIKSLIHIFRNAVDHGIEGPDHRIEAGKDHIGRISCHVASIDNKIEIAIEDDGCGINLEKLKSKAIEKNIISTEKAKTQTEAQLLELLFLDNFSTTDKITETSGRGYGLSATKNELEKLGGTLEIKSTPGIGTKFIFKL